MKAPSNPLAGLLQAAIDESSKTTAHAAVSLAAVACGYMLPQATLVECLGGRVLLDFHSPWRNLKGKPLPPAEQGKAARKVKQVMERHYRLFPQAGFPDVSFLNCPKCVRGGICAKRHVENLRLQAVKRVQDAIDNQGWTAGLLSVVEPMTAQVTVMLHGHLLDKQTAKPVTDEEFAAFADAFDKQQKVEGFGQSGILVKRCQRCDHAAVPSDVPDPTPSPTDQPVSGDSQSFAA